MIDISVFTQALVHKENAEGSHASLALQEQFAMSKNHF